MTPQLCEKCGGKYNTPACPCRDWVSDPQVSSYADFMRNADQLRMRQEASDRAKADRAAAKQRQFAQMYGAPGANQAWPGQMPLPYEVERRPLDNVTKMPSWKLQPCLNCEHAKWMHSDLWVETDTDYVDYQGRPVKEKRERMGACTRAACACSRFNQTEEDMILDFLAGL